jgi:hypothetical protein
MSTVTEEMSGAELLLDVLYNIGGVLVGDDLKDFSWDPMVSGPGHLRGGLHHGFLGYILQQVAVLGQLANVGASVKDELSEKSEFQLLMERWEKIAYPEPRI